MGLFSGRAKEEDVLSIIKKYLKNSKIYEHPKPNSWGEQTFDQDYEYNGIVYKCPDILSIGENDSIILRVEVKGFEYLEEWNDVQIVKMEKRLFDSYLKLQKIEEIPCSVVFSIGKYGSGNYNYYWRTLNELSSLPKKYDFDSKYISQSGREKECVYWRVSDLNSGIESFIKHLQSVKDADW